MMRLTNLFATGIAAVMLALGAGVLGCKSDDAGQQPAKAAPAEKPAAKPAAKSSAPAGSKLSKVENNMSPEQVQEVLGPPTGQSSYPSAKTFNPYNFGGDSGNRVEYKYKGQGRVVFAVPRYGGNMKVVRVDYDPAEDGQ